ncbi:MAG: hypothetical protein PHE55_21635 [Methylococcaceae bacterium]|nr:hypothetical protein [Methylococcaceae bacterium]
MAPIKISTLPIKTSTLPIQILAAPSKASTGDTSDAEVEGNGCHNGREEHALCPQRGSLPLKNAFFIHEEETPPSLKNTFFTHEEEALYP